MKRVISKYAKATTIIAFCLSFLVAKTTNGQWEELGGSNTSKLNGVINSIVKDSHENIYAAGEFTNGRNNNFGKYYVAKWNGSSWSELGGTNTSTFNGKIKSITTDTSGNVYAAGEFYNSGNNNYYVYKWNGSSWSELGGIYGSSFRGQIYSITIDIKGNLYAVGSFTNGYGKPFVAKWDGGSWNELGSSSDSIFNKSILSITTDTSGNLYAGGVFYNSNNYYFVAKWDGSTWSELGGSNTSTFNDDISCIAIDSKGYIFIGGNYTNTNGRHYVAEWNGSAWDELGGNQDSIFNNFIGRITTDTHGNLYTTGNFYNSNYYYYVAKWNGSSWGELGGTNTSTFSGNINSTITDANGNLYIAGGFTNDSGYYYISKYNPTGLPVKLSYFTASTNNKTIQTNWHTTIELNTANFIIQHSTDGSSFSDICTVKAIGSGANGYSFTDTHPTNGINYYRLQSVDKDGASTYSKVVSCEWLVVSKQLAVYPNPSKSFVTVIGNHIASVQMIDNIGRVARTVSLKDAMNPILSVGGLQAGVYHLRVQTTDGKVSNVGMIVN